MYLFENLFSSIFMQSQRMFFAMFFPLSSHSVLPTCQGINRTRTCRGVSRCCENFRCFPAQEKQFSKTTGNKTHGDFVGFRKNWTETMVIFPWKIVIFPWKIVIFHLRFTGFVEDDNSGLCHILNFAPGRSAQLIPSNPLPTQLEGSEGYHGGPIYGPYSSRPQQYSTLGLSSMLEGLEYCWGLDDV